MYTKRKITLNHFANTNLKKDEAISHGDKIFYPLYLEIIYRRQHLQIKSALNTYCTKELVVKTGEEPGMMKIEKDIVTRIVRFEEKYFGEKYTLRGLGKRYNKYRMPIYKFINNLQRSRIKEAVKAANSEYFNVLNFDNENLSAERLFKASLILVDKLANYLDVERFKQELEVWREYFDLHPIKVIGEFKFPMFLDWLDDGHHEILKKHLNKEKEISRDFKTSYIDEINDYIIVATIGQ